MGILSGKDIYSPKWITADITDSSGEVHYIPIKQTLGEYFLTDIKGQYYIFKIDSSRIKTWRKTFAKSFRKIYYDTSHYLPISAADTKELGDVLQKNNLPRVSGHLFSLLKIAGHKEKEGQEFEPQDLKEIIDNLKPEGQTEQAAVMNIRNFLTHLDSDKIVTPVRHVTEFIEDEIIASDPKFMGTIVKSYLAAKGMLDKVTNTEVNAKGPWLKVALFGLIIGLGIFIVWFMYDTGVLEDFGLEGMFGGVGESETDRILRQYQPDQLKIAIESGELEYDELPKDIRNMYDSQLKDKEIGTPVATPIP